ncbi:UNKNOWN [Stylonychia lemnae]|uniref:Uncharacterized protein n=1 Tax=Stylonychia lemnae TaxID=5949 RepID=A0A078BAZ0_STYLE|nr:UNKNOWN [Stylonychia lemnae]|eukprot:CDW91559.1 UNKNOWN [Stylonychia lemnae]
MKSLCLIIGAVAVLLNTAQACKNTLFKGHQGTNIYKLCKTYIDEMQYLSEPCRDSYDPRVQAPQDNTDIFKNIPDPGEYAIAMFSDSSPKYTFAFERNPKVKQLKEQDVQLLIQNGYRPQQISLIRRDNWRLNQASFPSEMGQVFMKGGPLEIYEIEVASPFFGAYPFSQDREYTLRDKKQHKKSKSFVENKILQ